MTKIKDIAKAANVSLSTVSKALNNRRDVSEETRNRVLEIAHELDFVPRSLSKNYYRKKTENIGVIFCREYQPLSSNPFYSRVLEGIEAELTINGYNLILHLLPEDYKGESPKMLKDHTVDGVILVGSLDREFVNQLRKLNMYVVMVDPKIDVGDFNQVLIDNEQGAFSAIQYLINKGHKKIGFISGALERLSFRQRYSGYLKALKYNNLSLRKDYVKTGGLEKKYDHMSKLINLKNRPTAVFAANDINAIYGYKAVKDHKLNIPDDISVVGFDDIDLAKMTTPPLTTIRVYKEEMGSIGVRNLLRLIQGETKQVATTIIPIRLIERESVKKS